MRFGFFCFPRLWCFRNPVFLLPRTADAAGQWPGSSCYRSALTKPCSVQYSVGTIPSSRMYSDWACTVLPCISADGFNRLIHTRVCLAIFVLPGDRSGFNSESVCAGRAWARPLYRVDFSALSGTTCGSSMTEKAARYELRAFPGCSAKTAEVFSL